MSKCGETGTLIHADGPIKWLILDYGKHVNGSSKSLT